MPSPGALANQLNHDIGRSRESLRRMSCRTSAYQHRNIGVLAIQAIDRREVFVSVEPEKGCNLCVAESIQQEHRPAERSCRVAHGCDGMTHIVLTVAKCTLPVLPCFSPVDGGEAHQQTVFGKEFAQLERRVAIERTPSLEAMISADVVVDAGR